MNANNHLKKRNQTIFLFKPWFGNIDINERKAVSELMATAVATTVARGIAKGVLYFNA